MIMQREVDKVVEHYDADFIDPALVNSFIRYSLRSTVLKNGHVTFDGRVSLGDCGKVISWDGEYEDEAPALILQRKLDKAISILQKCVKVLDEHVAMKEHEIKYKTTKSFIFDSRDCGAEPRLEILNQQMGVWRCRTAFNCTLACPREIQITKAIAEVKMAALRGKIE